MANVVVIFALALCVFFAVRSVVRQKRAQAQSGQVCLCSCGTSCTKKECSCACSALIDEQAKEVSHDLN